MFYTREDIKEKGYSVYLNGVKQLYDSVVEADTDVGTVLLEETLYTGWGNVPTITTIRKYGRVHMVLEEVLENNCNKEETCDESDCDECTTDDDIVFGDGSHI